MGKVADIFILNTIVLILSLLIIPIGPAIIALFYVALKEVRDMEGNIISEFFKSFKQNFLQGVIVEIIVTAISLFFAYDIYLMYHWMLSEQAPWTKLVFAAICGVVLMIAFGLLYVFPMIAKFYNTTGKIFKNSMAMAIGNLPYTILIATITAGIVYGVIRLPMLVAVAIATWAFITSIFFNKVFDRYIPKKEESSEDELPPIEEVHTVMDAPYTASTMYVPPVEDENQDEDVSE